MSRLIYRATFFVRIVAFLAFSVAIFPFPDASAQQSHPNKLTFNRDIRPILSDRCFACHGPDAETREADLRLDESESASQDRGGYAALMPGNVEASELLVRVTTDDASLRMPPPEYGEPLSSEQISILRRWIEEGATYETHWSFTPPTRPEVPRPEVPRTSDSLASDSPIDAFISSQLQQQGLKAVGAADPRTLVRRLAFDLTGLPPNTELVENYQQNPNAETYRKLVDELLSSPHYGERMAMYWLDLVRYADTLGYHGDQERSVSPYRDYVIHAFNANIPFDQFTVEQIAGDLLPNPTLPQLVASTYNRLNRASGEGGVQPKEYLAKYSADRVRTTGAVWLGTTFGCAECHDHKFDPFTAKDFYSFAAFFADIKEQGIVAGARHIELLPVPSEEQQLELAQLEASLDSVKREYESDSDSLQMAFSEWKQGIADESNRWQVLIPASVESEAKTPFDILEDHSILARGSNPENDNYTVSARLSTSSLAAIRLEVLVDESLPNKGPGRAGNGNFVLQGVEVTLDGEKVEWAKAFATHTQNQHSPDFVINGNKNGWAILPETGRSHQLVLIAKQPIVGKSDAPEIRVRIVQQFGSGHTIGKFRLAIAGASEGNSAIAFAEPQIAALAQKAADELSATDKATLDKAFREQTPLLADVRNRLHDLQNKKARLEQSIPTTLVTKATTPREIRILPRGDWMNDSGPIVLPAVPDFMPRGQLEARQESGERLNRLDLARWMTDPANPLVARTFVNRLWMLFFGNGLSRSVDDLGSQGELPSHPELLDWLSVEFIESGWDVQHIIRLIVESDAYKRDSRATEELRLKDPYNRQLARQSRFRLDAEMVRDNALAISGLLIRDIGGPSVRPYQPAGYWAQLNFPKREYQNDTGRSQYRRGVYTHWQRTFLHPSMLAFDAPAREECTAKRERSSTPLQSLVLLNDPSYVEAARVLAARTMRESEGDTAKRLQWLFQTSLGRGPREAELQILSDLYQSNLDQYRQAESQAKELLSVGQAVSPEDLDAGELAAWTAVTRAVLNLHEIIMRY